MKLIIIISWSTKSPTAAALIIIIIMAALRAISNRNDIIAWSQWAPHPPLPPRCSFSAIIIVIMASLYYREVSLRFDFPPPTDYYHSIVIRSWGPAAAASSMLMLWLWSTFIISCSLLSIFSAYLKVNIRVCCFLRLRQYRILLWARSTRIALWISIAGQQPHHWFQIASSGEEEGVNQK